MDEETVYLRPATLPLDGFDELLQESVADGHAMLRRLIDDWHAGSNRFSRIGELLLAAHANHRLVGVCGRNIDPYGNQPRVGRVRHLYVRRDARRQGVGRDLVRTIVTDAPDYFDTIQLRAPPAAFAFYEALGFARLKDDPFATHRMQLR